MKERKGKSVKKVKIRISSMYEFYCDVCSGEEIGYRTSGLLFDDITADDHYPYSEVEEIGDFLEEYAEKVDGDENEETWEVIRVYEVPEKDIEKIKECIQKEWIDCGNCVMRVIGDGEERKVKVI